MGEYELLIAALGRRDAETALAIWRQHLQNTGTAVAKALRSVNLSR